MKKAEHTKTLLGKKNKKLVDFEKMKRKRERTAAKKNIFKKKELGKEKRKT